MAYHLHWPWSEIVELDIGERKGFVRMLAERIDADNRAWESLAGQMRRG